MDNFRLHDLLVPPSPPVGPRPTQKPSARKSKKISAVSPQVRPQRKAPATKGKRQRAPMHLPSLSPTGGAAQAPLPPTPTRRKLIIDLDASRQELHTAVGKARRESNKSGQAIASAVGWRAARRALHQHRFRAPLSPKRTIVGIECTRTPCSSPAHRAALTQLPTLA